MEQDQGPSVRTAASVSSSWTTPPTPPLRRTAATTPTNERGVQRGRRAHSPARAAARSVNGPTKASQFHTALAPRESASPEKPAWRTHRSRYSLNSCYTFSVYQDPSASPAPEMEHASAKEAQWAKHFANWSTLESKPAKLRKLCRSPIPHSCIGEFWKRCCHVQDFASKNPESYRSMLSLKSIDEDKIIKDIPRTFPDEEFFAMDSSQASLFNVLKAYSVMDPELGYCQGMNFIAATMLFHMPEEDAFWLLVQMIKSYELRDNFSADVPALHENLYIVDRCIERFLPKLFSHFKAENVTPGMFASEWFSTLFVYTLKFNVVFRVWSVFFVEGKSYLYRCGLAVLKLCEDALLKLSFADIVNFLKKEVDIVADKLIATADSIRITDALLDEFRRDYGHPSTSQDYF